MAELGPKQRLPITDSPWFWVLLFSLVGLAGLAAIGPKFARREQAIETKFHARERAYGREAKDQPVVPPAGDEAAPPGQLFEPAWTLGPIAAVIGVIAFVGLVGVLRFYRWQGVEHSNERQSND